MQHFIHYGVINRLCLSLRNSFLRSSSFFMYAAISSSFWKTLLAWLKRLFTVSTKIGCVRNEGMFPPTSNWRTYSASKESGPVGVSVVQNKCDLALVWRSQSGKR